jgi:hypothetical protein
VKFQLRNKINTDEHGLAGKRAETGTCGLLSGSRGTSANSEDDVPGEQLVLRGRPEKSHRDESRVGGALSLLGFFADGCCFVLVGQSVENTGTLTYTKRHEKLFFFS